MGLFAGRNWLFILCLFFLKTYCEAHIVAPVEVRGLDITTNQTVTIEYNSRNLKGVVVIFLSAACPVTESHLAEIRRLSEEYNQYQFVGIHSNLEEPLEKARTYFKKADLRFPFIQDQNQHLANEFRALKTPHAFLVDVDRNILYQGGISDSEERTSAKIFYLRNALKDHSSGKSIKIPYGRTLGCVIQRGDEHVW